MDTEETAAHQEQSPAGQAGQNQKERKRRGYCRACGALFFLNGEGERPNGYLGPVAVAVAGFLRYVVKMPFESVRKIFAGLWGLEITPLASRRLFA
jgi:hypothetical protein